MKFEKKTQIEHLCLRLQKSGTLSGVFYLVRLGEFFAHENFYKEENLKRLVTTTLLMQTRKDKPLLVRSHALHLLKDFYLHRYFENDLPLKATVLRTIAHISLRDRNIKQRHRAVEILGQALNRVPYETEKNLTTIAASALIQIVRDAEENFKLREQALYFLDISIDNLAFHPNRKIQKLSSHFPAATGCEQTDTALRFLPHRIRSIAFKKQNGALPKNRGVFVPYFS